MLPTQLNSNNSKRLNSSVSNGHSTNRTKTYDEWSRFLLNYETFLLFAAFYSMEAMLQETFSTPICFE